MTPGFLPLRDLEALDGALARAATEPILIFKHSPACGISAQAHAEIGDWLAVGGGALPVYLVSVREHRAVSTTIAERFGVRHESPQLLLVHGGVVRWHGSHFRVTPAAIDAAVGRLPRPPA